MDNYELRSLAQELIIELVRRNRERGWTEIERECWRELNDLVLNSPEFKC